jgi:hypothetical protein
LGLDDEDDADEDEDEDLDEESIVVLEWVESVILKRYI